MHGVRELVVAPMLIWAWALRVWWFTVQRPPLHDACRATWLDALLVPYWCPTLRSGLTYVAPAAGVGVAVAGYAVVALIFTVHKDAGQARMFLADIGGWVFACMVGGVLLLVGGSLPVGLSAAQLAVLGPPWVILSHMVASMVYVAIRREPARGDLEREWLARVSAAKAMVGVAWLSLASVVLLLPPLVLDGGLADTDRWLSGQAATLEALAASGGVVAALGRGAQTAGAALLSKLRSKVHLSLEAVLGLATLVFLAALFMLLGALAARGVDWLARNAGCGRSAADEAVAAALLLILTGGLRGAPGRSSTSTSFPCTRSTATACRGRFLGPRCAPSSACPTHGPALTHSTTLAWPLGAAAEL